MVIITGSASVSCFCGSEATGHRRIHSRVGQVRIAERSAAGRESLRQSSGRPAGWRQQCEDACRAAASAITCAASSSCLARSPRRQNPGAGAFRYRVAAGHAGADADSRGEGPLVGTGRAGHEIGHCVLCFRHPHASRCSKSRCARNILLQVNSDEEVGSETSRHFTEEAARQSAVALLRRTRHRAQGQAQDRAQRRRRLYRHGEGQGVARRCGLRSGRQRGGGTGAPDPENRRRSPI